MTNILEKTYYTNTSPIKENKKIDQKNIKSIVIKRMPEIKCIEES